MRSEEFEKIVVALEAIDRMFPKQFSETPREVIEFRSRVVRLAGDGVKILEKLKSKE